MTTSLLFSRIQSIDALRGMVMLIMLLDHVREYFFLHRQVSDPINIDTTDPFLFTARVLAHLCPTIFIFLTGMSAYLYAERYQASKAALSRYLLERGLLLIALEITVINFAWMLVFPPEMLYLQVIWVIGLSMVALAGLIWLPMPAIAMFGLVIIFGHNLLSSIDFMPESFGYMPWAILHDRSVITITESLSLRTSYPLLPWVGVIALGYAVGQWFMKHQHTNKELPTITRLGIALIIGFLLLRYSNMYGESAPWLVYPTDTQTLMSFFNITKYPASLLFIMLTCGMGMLLFVGLRKLEIRASKMVDILSMYGKAPMFFYILHLYVIQLLYQIALSIHGMNQGNRYGFDTLGENWLLGFALMPLLYYACKKFLAFKQTHDYKWLRYM